MVTSNATSVRRRYITEQEVLEALAVSSHETYMKQKAEDLIKKNNPVPVMDPNPTAHDQERARNAVEVLKDLGFTFPHNLW